MIIIIILLIVIAFGIFLLSETGREILDGVFSFTGELFRYAKKFTVVTLLTVGAMIFVYGAKLILTNQPIESTYDFNWFAGFFALAIMLGIFIAVFRGLKEMFTKKHTNTNEEVIEESPKKQVPEIQEKDDEATVVITCGACGTKNRIMRDQGVSKLKCSGCERESNIAT